MTTTIKSYSELIKLPTYMERLEYLRIGQVVADITFGPYRYLNQRFYKSLKWKHTRQEIILRDRGRDLGIEGREIYGTAYVHHMNPITKDDLVEDSAKLYDPENLITVSYDTHNAIHYMDTEKIKMADELIERYPNDTCPWKG